MLSQTSISKLHFKKLLSGSLKDPFSRNSPAAHAQAGKRKLVLLFTLLISGWGCVNLLQSYFTPIANDEAYYWMFSKNLAWGYFDHPPMIAAFIKAGHLILNGEAGTRMITVFAQILSLILIWKIIDDKAATAKKLWLYFGIAASIPVFAIYGFIATPDNPLLLFTALFLISYKRFLEKENLVSVAMMSIAMAGLMYSKYHGALVMLLVALSNLQLLVNARFLIAALTSCMLCIPHIAWQITYGFPTLEFQMMDRMESIHAQHFFEYWLNQAVAFNPAILFFLALIFTKTRPASVFDRSLYFIPAGFLCFFWISSLWTRSEPHWTAAASIPIIILVYRFISKDQTHLSAAARWILISLILIALARLTIILDFLPIPHEFRQQKEWAINVSAKAGDLPAVFVNTFQKPSVYTFYTGKESFTLNNIYYRKNQYDIWDYEESFQGKEVAFFIKPSDSLRITDYTVEKVNGFLHFNDTLHSLQNLAIDFKMNPQTKYARGEMIHLHATISNGSAGEVILDNNERNLLAVFIKNKKLTRIPVTINASPIRLAKGGKAIVEIFCRVPDLPAGYYGFLLGYQTEMLPEGFHSRPQKIRIIDSL